MQAGKHPQAIATKVLPPRCVGLIERPRLLELVTQVEMKPLSVIKAGAANYGVGLALSGRVRSRRNISPKRLSAPIRLVPLQEPTLRRTSLKPVNTTRLVLSQHIC